MELFDYERGTARVLPDDATVTFDVGSYAIDVSGDFSAGILALRAADGAVVAAYDEPGMQMPKITPGEYRFQITGTIGALGIMIRRYAPDTTGGFANSSAPNPAPMNDAGYMARWLQRHDFALIGDHWSGTLTADAAAELIDRHKPPLPVTPATIAPDYQPVPGATITISRGGHVLDGAAVLCTVVARNLALPVTFVVE